MFPLLCFSSFFFWWGGAVDEVLGDVCGFSQMNGFHNGPNVGLGYLNHAQRYFWANGPQNYGCHQNNWATLENLSLFARNSHPPMFVGSLSLHFKNLRKI